MFTIIEGLPGDALGVNATGTIVRSDYREVLVPEAKKKLAKYSIINMLFVAGPDFIGYEPGAIWDDAAFGLRHWRDFNKIALVTDSERLADAVRFFSLFFPGTVKIFGMTKIDAATNWLATPEKQESIQG